MKSAFYLSALFCGLLLLIARPASAQGTKMFMKAIFFKQGAITGEAVIKEGILTGFLPLTNVSFNESAPSTAAVYHDKGAIKHEVLKVSKKVDASSPQFLTAFSNSESFSEVLIDFDQTGKDGKGKDKLVVFMTIKLGGGTFISDFKQNGNSETISFSYTEMTVTEPTPVH